jgi:hypothetical protein
MRTFPRELAAFRELVNRRGAELRLLTYEELKTYASAPLEHVMVESRPVTIGFIVLPAADGAITVVLQGNMKGGPFPGSSVALDGFYKHPDGTVAAMPDEELYEFG